VLRSMPATDISSRAISHPSASRQHPPAPWMSSIRALAPSGSICLLCRWPHPFVWYRRRRGVSLHCLLAPAPGFTRQPLVVLHWSSPTLASAWPWFGRAAGRGTGPGWGSRGGVVRWGWNGAGQEAVGRTAGRGGNTGGRLVPLGQLAAGQVRRKTGTGSCAQWEVTGPFLGRQLPFLPSGPPWGEITRDPPAHTGPAALELAKHGGTSHPKLSPRPGHVP